MFSSKPSILIVDDDTAILRSLTKIFQKKGYNVTVAKEGQKAIEEIGAHSYDVALVDLGLPDMEGDKLFPLINHASPNTLKIMLTGKIELEDTIEGADVFIGKPVAPDRLLSIINAELSRKLKNAENE